jgi:hypothetical protein
LNSSSVVLEENDDISSEPLPQTSDTSSTLQSSVESPEWPSWLTAVLEFLNATESPPGSSWPQLVQRLVTLDQLLGFPSGKVILISFGLLFPSNPYILSRKPSSYLQRDAHLKSHIGSIVAASSQIYRPYLILPHMRHRSMIGGGHYNREHAPLPQEYLHMMLMVKKHGIRLEREE